MLTLYGSSQGRPSRSLIALEELGLAYQQVPLKPWDNAADADALAALNPNARVPVLDDDGLVVWESMAINLYLGDRYGGPLWPTEARDRARLYQWSLWSQTSIDVMARHRARFSEDPETKARAEAERLAALAILDAALADRPYLLGAAFTLADINAAATLVEPWEQGRIDGNLDPAAHGLAALADWLARCTARPSWAKVRALP
jgi:glutathione S-transferase